MREQKVIGEERPLRKVCFCFTVIVHERVGICTITAQSKRGFNHKLKPDREKTRQLRFPDVLTWRGGLGKDEGSVKREKRKKKLF